MFHWLLLPVWLHIYIQIVYRYRHECITSCVYITLYTYIWNIIVWSYIISYIVHPWNDSRQISQWLVHPFFCSSQAINMGQSSMDTHVETQPISGWWLSLPLWKMMEFVSWDDFSIPNMMGKSKKSMVPKHQPEYFSYHVEKKNTIHSFGFTTSKREISHIQKGTCRWLRLRATNSWGTTLITYASDMVFATPVKQQDISVLHDLVYHQPVTIGYWTCVIPLSSDKIHQC